MRVRRQQESARQVAGWLAGAHIADVNAGHLSLISRANTVTKVIVDAAYATG